LLLIEPAKAVEVVVLAVRVAAVPELLVMMPPSPGRILALRI